MGQDNKKIIKTHTSALVYQEYFWSRLCILCVKKRDQDTYHVTISKMDEVEIFNELDTILESIHANFIVLYTWPLRAYIWPRYIWML
jgi:hypothetical protein